MAIVGWPDEVSEMEEGESYQYIYQSPMGNWWIKYQTVSDAGVRKVGEANGSAGPFETKDDAIQKAESDKNEQGPVFVRE